MSPSTKKKRVGLEAGCRERDIRLLGRRIAQLIEMGGDCGMVSLRVTTEGELDLIVRDSEGDESAFGGLPLSGRTMLSVTINVVKDAHDFYALGG